MTSGRNKGFWRRVRNGLLSQDQVMAVDVQLEDEIRKIEGLVGGYLRSPQDEATRQALLAELEKLDDQTARADAYSNVKAVLVRYQVPRSWVIGATSGTSTGEDPPIPRGGPGGHARAPARIPLRHFASPTLDPCAGSSRSRRAEGAPFEAVQSGRIRSNPARGLGLPRPKRRDYVFLTHGQVSEGRLRR